MPFETDPSIFWKKKKHNLKDPGTLLRILTVQNNSDLRMSESELY